MLFRSHDDCELGKDVQRNNDFLYLQKDADGKDDAEGFRCPVGSHVRRSNPRDTLQPNPTRSLVIANRHRILRRGRPYAENPATPGTENTKGKEVGLIFIAINADIQRQFEFIQQTWINSPKFNGLYDNKDPIVGNNNEASDSEDSTNNPGMGNGDAKGSLTIQRYPVRLRVQGIPRFVEVRGGGYFFLPSLQALHFLAALA